MEWDLKISARELNRWSTLTPLRKPQLSINKSQDLQLVQGSNPRQNSQENSG